jgi:hypothetical protein
MEDPVDFNFDPSHFPVSLEGWTLSGKMGLENGRTIQKQQ